MNDPERSPTEDRLPGWRRKAQPVLLAFAAVAVPLAGWRIAERAPTAFGPTGRHISHLGSGARVSAEFDLSDLSLPPEAIHRGGPPKDGIPALTNPAFVDADAAAYLTDESEVIGVHLGGEARAYPLAILDYHEVVNDSVGGVPVAVTYCPLCDSSVVFARSDGDGEPREFGVSGRLFNSNVLIYDRLVGAVESLWTQMGAIGVSGPARDKRLTRLPMEVTTWGQWRERHPASLVLSDTTGHARTYDRSVYAGYFARDQLMFPVDHEDDRLPPKTPILGVASGGVSRAYTRASPSAPARRRERLGDAEFDLVADGVTGRLRIENVSGDAEWCYSFWFAWAAFRPDTELVPFGAD